MVDEVGWPGKPGDGSRQAPDGGAHAGLPSR